MRAVAGGEEGESELPYLLVTEEEVRSNIFIFFPKERDIFGAGLLFRLGLWRIPLFLKRATPSNWSQDM